MGNYCNPYATVVDHKGYPEKEHKVSGEIQTEITAENQVDHLEVKNSERFDELASPRNIDQKNNKRLQQKGNGKIVVEQLQNKPPDTLKPVDEQKETLVAHCSKGSVQSSSSSIILQEGAKAEKQQKVNEDADEESVVEYSIYQEKNIVTAKKSTSRGFKTPAWIKNIGRNDKAETSCLKTNLLAEKKSAVEHNKTAVKKGDQVTSCVGNSVDKDNNVGKQLQLNEEHEVHRLENEILEKRKVIDKQNETLTKLSDQKEERAKDLQNLEHRVATIKLQSELKERAFIVANEGIKEKTSRMVTLIEGRLSKFGRGGMTNPKEKWVQLRRYPKGQVLLDYAELFLSVKFERNQVTSVERGESYLSGDGSSYNGRVFAVHTNSTDKHKHMVFAAESEELCGKWIEILKHAFDQKQTDVHLGIPKIPVAGKQKSEENGIEIIPNNDEETAARGLPLPTTKSATETEAPKLDSEEVVEKTSNDAVDREVLEKQLFEAKIGIRKRKSQKILSPDESPKERSDSQAEKAQKTPPPASDDKAESPPWPRGRTSLSLIVDTKSEGAHSVDFSNLEQKATSLQMDSAQLRMNTLEHSSQRRSSTISTSSTGGKYGLSVTATL